MAQREAVTQRQTALPTGQWPVDEDGLPMALVTFQASELIGLPNYSNVTIGPGSVTRFVADDPEARKAGLRDCVREVEKIIAEEREVVLDLIRSNED